MSGNRFFIIRLLVSTWLVVCVWFTLAPVAHAEAKPAETFTLAELMHLLAQVKSSSATFVERKYLSMMYTPLEYSGTLSYTSPGHVERHTLQPTPESMVLEKDILTMQGGLYGKQRVLPIREYPAAWAFTESFRSTLAGDLATLNRFYQLKLEGQAKKWLLVLKPIEPTMKQLVSEIRIGGSDAWIATIEIRETGGDYSVMTIRKDGT